MPKQKRARCQGPSLPRSQRAPSCDPFLLHGFTGSPHVQAWLGARGRQPRVREAAAVVWAECRPVQGGRLVPPTQGRGPLRQMRSLVQNSRLWEQQYKEPWEFRTVQVGEMGAGRRERQFGA